VVRDGQVDDPPPGEDPCRDLRRRRQAGRAFHASLHSSGAWHIAFDRAYVATENSVLPPNEDRIRSRWTPDLSQPVIRAFAIATPATEVQIPPYPEEELADEIYWHPKPAFGMVAYFNIILTPRSTYTSAWPGRRLMGTLPVASATLSGWGHLWIVVHDEPEATGLRPRLNDLKRRIRVGGGDPREADIRAIGVGTFDDGTYCFTDLLIRGPS
jgi:hypothetical protein